MNLKIIFSICFTFADTADHFRHQCFYLYYFQGHWNYFCWTLILCLHVLNPVYCTIDLQKNDFFQLDYILFTEIYMVCFSALIRATQKEESSGWNLEVSTCTAMHSISNIHFSFLSVPGKDLSEQNCSVTSLPGVVSLCPRWATIESQWISGSFLATQRPAGCACPRANSISPVWLIQRKTAGNKQQQQNLWRGGEITIRLPKPSSAFYLFFICFSRVSFSKEPLTSRSITAAQKW